MLLVKNITIKTRATVRLRLKHNEINCIVHVFTLLHKISQCCGSGMFIPDPNFTSRIRIPDPRSKRFRILDPGSESASKNLSFLTQKVVPKLSEIWSRMFIPYPGSDILPIPDPGQKGTRSPIRIHNTEKSYVNSGQTVSWSTVECFIYFYVNAISVKDHIAVRIAVGSELILQ